MQYDIFISYKRRGTSSATAAYIYDLLTKKGFSVFFDRKEMGQGAFNEQLYNHIENAKDVIVLLEDQSLAACFKERSHFGIESSANEKTADSEKDENAKNKQNYEQSDSAGVASAISQAYKSDWFCMEIMHALEVKQKKGDDLHIIPLLLEGYKMPDANKLPPEMRELAMQNAINLEISDVETVYQKYLAGERPYLKSKPTNLFLAQQNGSGVADFLFFSEKNGSNEGHCDIYEFGNLIGRIDQNIDEEHPYIFSVKRAGEHRFKMKNCDTCEEQIVSASVEKDKQQYVPITWGISQNLWEITPEIIQKEDDSRKLYAWGKGLYEGNFKHSPDFRCALNCLKESAELRYAEARNFIVRNFELFLNKNSKEFKSNEEETTLKLEWLKTAADFGGSSAQYEYGRRLCTGEGVERNIDECLAYYKLAAQQKDFEPHSLYKPEPQALYELGKLFFDGYKSSIKKNVQKGLDYYKQAADLGHTKAMMDLARIYIDGENGILPNEQEGFKYYDKAASSNNADTLYELANIYFRGDGIASNIPKSLEYYQQAANLNSLDALFDLGKIYFYGTYCVKKDSEKGFSYYKKAADLNEPKAILTTARILLTGEHGIEKNEQLGHEYLEKILVLNDANSLFDLGLIYINGFHGVKENIAKGKQCFERILKLDGVDPYLLLKLGDIYLSGLFGIEKDSQKTEECYEKALNNVDSNVYDVAYTFINQLLKGNYTPSNTQRLIDSLKNKASKRPSIWSLIGELYLRGCNNITQNIEEGIRCYEYGFKECPFRDDIKMVADIYLDGDLDNGIVPNPAKAIEYYEKAALIDPRFYEELGDLYFNGYKGIKKDTDKALQCYEHRLPHLERFGIPFVIKLANIYLNGTNGVKKNPQKAIECYEHAAQDKPELWVELGNLYFKGAPGIERDPLKALYCYEQAIQRNYTENDLVRKVAFAYLDGDYGMEPDPEKAIQCYQTAAKNNSSFWIELGDLYFKGLDTIERNEEEGIKCYERALQGKDIDFYTVKKVANIHLNGLYGYKASEEEALLYFEKAARKNPEIWEELGNLLLEGQDGYTQNFSKGVECFERSIHDSLFSSTKLLEFSLFSKYRRRRRRSSKISSVDRLVSIYLEGRYSQEPNTRLAIELLERLAQSNSSYWSELGNLYYNGHRNLERNLKKAVECYEKALQKSPYDSDYCIDKVSLNNLSEIFINGCEGVNSNISKVEHCYEVAGLKKPEFFINLGDLFLKGNGKLAPNTEKALFFYNQYLSPSYHHDYDNIEKIANIYLNGECGITPCLQKAIDCYKQAATTNPRFWHRLADLYVDGVIVADGDEVIKYYEMAAKESGYRYRADDSYEKIAEIYLNGACGVPKNVDKAIEYFKLAASLNSDYWIDLGNIYLDGTNGINIDVNEGIRCYEKALHSEYISGNSIRKLASIYLNGEFGIDKNPQKAIDYYKLAAPNKSSCWIEIGDYYLSEAKRGKGDINLAIEYYEKGLLNGGRTRYILDKFMEIYSEKKFRKVLIADKIIEYYKIAALRDCDYWAKLGDFYFEGKLVDLNAETGLKYYERALLEDFVNEELVEKLANIYMNGEYGIPRNPQRAVELYEHAAQSQPSLFGKLGDLYLNGREGLKPNLKKGLRCYEKAIEKDNNSRIVKEMASIYFEGKYGVEKNPQKALECYEKAIMNGCHDHDIIEKVAKIYLNGDYGITPNPQKGIDFYKQSAEHNSDDWAIVGDIYLDGQFGFEPNVEEGLKCYDKAIQGMNFFINEKIIDRITDIYANGLYEIEPNPWKAIEYFKKAANEDPDYWVKIGMIYLEGTYHIAPDIEEGQKYLEKAFHNKQVSASKSSKVAFIYLDGLYGIPVDTQKGLAWFEKSASTNANWWADFGDLYLEGSHGIERNAKKGLEYYEKILEKGKPNRDNVKKLVQITLEGIDDIEPNPTKAIEYLEKALEKDPYFGEILGVLYLCGLYGVPRNNKLGLKYYEVAAKKYPGLWVDLGNKFYTGSNLEQSFDLAQKCYTKALTTGEGDLCELKSALILDNMKEKKLGKKPYPKHKAIPDLIDSFLKIDCRPEFMYDNIVRTFYAIKEYDAALSWAERAVNELPNNCTILDNLGHVYKRLGRYNEAIEAFQKGLDLGDSGAAGQIEEVKTLIKGSKKKPTTKASKKTKL